MAAWGGPDVRSMDDDEEAKMLIVTKRKVKDICEHANLFLLTEKPLNQSHHCRHHGCDQKRQI